MFVQRVKLRSRLIIKLKIILVPRCTESNHLTVLHYSNVFLLPYFPLPQERLRLLDVCTSQPNASAVFAVQGGSDFLALPCNQLTLLLGIMLIPEACVTLSNLLRRQPNCDLEAARGSLCSGSHCATQVSLFLDSGPRGEISVPRSSLVIKPSLVRSIVTWDLEGKAVYSMDPCITLLAERVCPSTGPILFVDVGSGHLPPNTSAVVSDSVTRQLQSAPDTTKFLAVVVCNGSHFILSVLQLSTSQFCILEGLFSPSTYDSMFQGVWKWLLERLAVARPVLAGSRSTPPCLFPRARRVFDQVERPARHCGPIAVMALGVAAAILRGSSSLGATDPVLDLQNGPLWRRLLNTSNVAMNIARLHMGRELMALHKQQHCCPSYAHTTALQMIANESVSAVRKVVNKSVAPACSVCSFVHSQ